MPTFSTATRPPRNSAALPTSSQRLDSGITRRAFLSGAAGLALTAAFGCGRSHSSNAGDSSFSTVIVTAFDVSASTSVKAVRERYFAEFQTVLNDLVANNDGDSYLAGYPITANTEATSTTRISQVFPAFRPLKVNKDDSDANLAHAKADALSQTRALMTGVRMAPATDLLNAFHDAANVFNGAAYRSATDKRLIIFSDMTQQAGADDFLREDLTERRINQIIAAQRAARQFPDLKGVKVWVAGATADPEGRIGPEKIAQIRQFWLAFFHDCGAELTTERYGTTLQNYP